MGIQHNENAPASFADALAPNYLGNPETVQRLVGEFLTASEELLFNLGAGMPKEDFTESAKELVRRNADIFSGRDTAFKTVMGYNEVSLKYKLMADLGEFWQKNRERWGDDAVCVLFEWLFVMLADSYKKADGDEMLLEVMLKPCVQYAVRVLLGIEERAM